MLDSEREEGPAALSYRDITGKNRTTYDANAAKYARSTGAYADFPGLRDEVLHFVDSVPQNGIVLDLGAGGGRDTLLISASGPAVVAADISFRMLDQVRMQVEAAADSTVGYVQLEMLELPFTDSTFAGVWACASLLHLPARALPAAFREILRVLHPGGIASISMKEGAGEGLQLGGSLPGPRWFTMTSPAQVLQLMASAGFDSRDSRYSGRPGWFVATGRKAL